MRQAFDEGSSFRFGKTIQRIHEVHVRPAAFQESDELLAQRLIVICPGAILFSDPLVLVLHEVSYFSERSNCCGDSGTACSVVLANPAFLNIFSYCEKV